MLGFNSKKELRSLCWHHCTGVRFVLEHVLKSYLLTSRLFTPHISLQVHSGLWTPSLLCRKTGNKKQLVLTLMH